jgi:hypothetical protein
VQGLNFPTPGGCCSRLLAVPPTSRRNLHRSLSITVRARRRSVPDITTAGVSMPRHTMRVAHSGTEFATHSEQVRAGFSVSPPSAAAKSSLRIFAVALRCWRTLRPPVNLGILAIPSGPTSFQVPRSPPDCARPGAFGPWSQPHSSQDRHRSGSDSKCNFAELPSSMASGARYFSLAVFSPAFFSCL